MFARPKLYALLMLVVAFTIFWVPAAVLSARASGGSQTVTAASADALCHGSATRRVMIQAVTDPREQLVFVVSQGTEKASEPARKVWEGDLNGDARSDLILVFPDACGNWAECPIGVYVRCADELFAVVLPPTYMWQLKVGVTRTHVGSSTWLELIEIARGGSATKETLSEVRWRFDGTTYRKHGALRRRVK